MPASSIPGRKRGTAALRPGRPTAFAGAITLAIAVAGLVANGDHLAIAPCPPLLVDCRAGLFPLVAEGSASARDGGASRPAEIRARRKVRRPRHRALAHRDTAQPPARRVAQRFAHQRPSRLGHLRHGPTRGTSAGTPHRSRRPAPDPDPGTNAPVDPGPGPAEPAPSAPSTDPTPPAAPPPGAVPSTQTASGQDGNLLAGLLQAVEGVASSLTTEQQP